MANVFIIEARCSANNKPFFVRCDMAADGTWVQTYGLRNRPVDRNSDSSEQKIDLNKVVIGPQYRCPYCGRRSFVKHGACGRISCYQHDLDKGNFHCGWCDEDGILDKPGSGADKPFDVDGRSGSGQ